MKVPQINISLVLLILLFASFTHQQTVQISGNTTCDTGAASPLIQTGISTFYSGTYSLTRQSNIASRLTTFQVNVNYPIPSTGLTVTVCKVLFIFSYWKNKWLQSGSRDWLLDQGQ